jgi:hypothetical protein
LRWEGFLGLLGEAIIITKFLLKERHEVREEKREDVTLAWRWRKGLSAKRCGQPLEDGKQGLWKECSPVDFRLLTSRTKKKKSEFMLFKITNLW